MLGYKKAKLSSYNTLILCTPLIDCKSIGSPQVPFVCQAYAAGAGDGQESSLREDPNPEGGSDMARHN